MPLAGVRSSNGFNTIDYCNIIKHIFSLLQIKNTQNLTKYHKLHRFWFPSILWSLAIIMFSQHNMPILVTILWCVCVLYPTIELLASHPPPPPPGPLLTTLCYTRDGDPGGGRSLAIDRCVNFTHSFIHSLINSFVHSFISFVFFIDSFIICSLIHFFHSFIHSFIFIHLFNVIHLFINQFIH